jgi:phosphate:Na+ symporter
MLAAMGANANSKRVAFIHFTFNVIGTVLFTAIIWIFKDFVVEMLVSIFPADDTMSLQMRVSIFHVIFNVTTTLLLLPFVQHLVKLSRLVIKDKNEETETRALRFVDNRLLAMPPVALMQVKKEMDYMLSLVEINTVRSFTSMETGSNEYGELISENEGIIDFTNSALTKFLIKLSAEVDTKDEKVIGAYFHVLNDLERIGDHAENFHEIGVEMASKGLQFSDVAKEEIAKMRERVMEMLAIAKDAFENLHKDVLPNLTALENEVDDMKKQLTANHFARLAEGACHVELSPYYSSTVAGLERVADHIVNVGYSILNPTGSQSEANN